MPQAIIGTLTPWPVREYGAAFAFSLDVEETDLDDPTSRSSLLMLASGPETVSRLTRRPAS